MRTKLHSARAMHTLLLVGLLAGGWARALPGQGLANQSQPKADPGFEEFLDRVNTYVRLHNSLDSTLPKLKTTDRPEVITAHERALAIKIGEARPTARPGDIFTRRARIAFRRAIRSEFQGSDGNAARTTIRQGEPLKEIHLRPNEIYPEGAPFTTVPPTLLLKFPKLPDTVAYRIVGRDLVLLDVKGNVVVDVMHEAIP
ncbi:MAG TPA: hypothetical protein VJN90_03640 [Candidatus Acidoferrales bacterium]|nr:hypothetical protein [Candidatus Acidoferrales bacterium]